MIINCPRFIVVPRVLNGPKRILVFTSIIRVGQGLVVPHVTPWWYKYQLISCVVAPSGYILFHLISFFSLGFVFQFFPSLLYRGS